MTGPYIVLQVSEEEGDERLTVTVLDKLIAGLLPKKLLATSTLSCSQHSTMDLCPKRINSSPQTLDSSNIR